MLRKVEAVRRWPVWIRVALTLVVIVAAYLLQIPLEREIPGEPFLLFFLVVLSATFAFGAITGFVAVATTTALSVPFFEPAGTFALDHAADLVKVEVYAVVATASTFALARYCEALNASLKQAEQTKSLLISELAHGVANNFASIAALINLKSRTVKDSHARAVLAEAIEQVKVMGRVHARLRAGDREALVDSGEFLAELCNDLRVSVARGRLVSIDCKADSLAIGMQQATSLGLIVNELVTNAIKHAFPNGRAGRIAVTFEVLKNELRLSVDDDGAGFCPRGRKDAGLGQELVSGLANQLGGHLEVASTTAGSSFRLSVPCVTRTPSIRSDQVAAPTIH